MLISSALGVSPEVFRKAFSLVSPAPAGDEPDPNQVKKNKEALLNVLSPYGVTNELLDKVSDYYRYVQSRGEVWKRRLAVAAVIVEEGLIKGIKILDGGSGYTTAPKVTVTNSKVIVKAEISFSKEFDKNGSVVSLTILEDK